MAVGGSGSVGVGGSIVLVGGTAVLEGGIDVLVGGMRVFVGRGVPVPGSRVRWKRGVMVGNWLAVGVGVRVTEGVAVGIVEVAVGRSDGVGVGTVDVGKGPSSSAAVRASAVFVRAA